MQYRERNTERGFSLVELMVVLVILGVLTTLAVLQFQTSTVDLERQAIAREFKVYLERARFDSVKRRADDARITLNSATSFTAQLDFDGNGAIDAHEVRTVDFTQKSRTLILVSDTFNFPLNINFDRRGHVQTIDGLGNEINPVFTICSNCTGDSPDRTVLSISTTGTVAVTQDIPDSSELPEPIITEPPYVLNCYVYVSNSNTNSNTNLCPL